MVRRVASVAVISSIYGGYDIAQAPPEQDTECEWVMVTDQEVMPMPWRTVTEPRTQLHPRLAAKVAKCHPEWYSSAEILIWADGNVKITAPDFVSWCVAQLGDSLLVQLRNPDRKTIYDEAGAGGGGKYAGLPVAGQAQHYVDRGFPEDFGTWWTGLMVARRSWSSWAGSAWLAEMVRWTYEDQVSQPYVLWSHGVRPGRLGVEFGERFHLIKHQDGTGV